MKNLFVLFALILAGCSSGGGSSSSSCGDKNLFALWTRSNGTLVFNLAGMSLGTPKTNYVVSFGAQSCTMTVLVSGAQCSGDYTITSSTWNGDGGSDPGCAGLNEVGTFTKSSAGLRACSTTYSTCHDYQ